MTAFIWFLLFVLGFTAVVAGPDAAAFVVVVAALLIGALIRNPPEKKP